MSQKETRVSRAPKGEYEKARKSLRLSLINPLMVFGQDASGGGLAHEVMFALSASDMWKDLTPAYGRCDCMVPGKYKRARIFAFETPMSYIWCETETGSRGTTWWMAKKGEPARADGFASYETGARELAEAAEFFVELCVGMGMASAEGMSRLQDRAPSLAAKAKARAKAMEEAEALEALTPAAARARGPKGI